LCFFFKNSRLSFSPDGSLLVVPTGVHRNLKPTNGASGTSSRTYATHVFVRDFWQTPAITLTGMEEPSVGIRFCPKPFQMLPSTEPPLFQAAYRWLYAVITIGSIFVYDTQHPHPLFKVTGIHYAAINDVAWSADGRVLVACSSDGYLTFIRFTENALGQTLADEFVPDIVKRSHPALYPQVLKVPESSEYVDENPGENIANSNAMDIVEVVDVPVEESKSMSVVASPAPTEKIVPNLSGQKRRIAPILLSTSLQSNATTVLSNTEII
jgi:hypothetical protein